MASSPEYQFESDAVFLSDTVFPPLHEEVVNTVTHGLGLAVAALAMPWLVSFALERGTPWHVIGCGIFGVTMLAVYAASTLYHGVQQRRAKHVLRVVDHVCIYLLIAGTYTPFALVEGGTWGWTILTLVWLFAAWGIFIKITRNDKLDAMSYLPYVAMGWLVLIAVKPILDTFPWDVLAWIGGGGLFYTAGVYFVAADRRFYHSIWHLFVLAGSACHFLAVMHYLEFRAV